MINNNSKDDDQITESLSQEGHKRNRVGMFEYRKAKRFSHVTLGPLPDQASARCGRKLITQGGKAGAKQREKILKREHF